MWWQCQKLKAIAVFAPSLYPQFIHPVCTHSLYTQSVPTVYTPSLYPQFIHPVCTHSLYTQSVPTVYTPSLYPQFIHPVCTHSLYTQSVSTVYTPSLLPRVYTPSLYPQFIHPVCTHSLYTQSVPTVYTPLFFDFRFLTFSHGQYIETTVRIIPQVSNISKPFWFELLPFLSSVWIMFSVQGYKILPMKGFCFLNEMLVDILQSECTHLSHLSLVSIYLTNVNCLKWKCRKLGLSLLLSFSLHSMHVWLVVGLELYLLVFLGWSSTVGRKKKPAHMAGRLNTEQNWQILRQTKDTFRIKTNNRQTSIHWDKWFGKSEKINENHLNWTLQGTVLLIRQLVDWIYI